MTKEADLDERFKFGPPPIQTAEDAVMAFLRKEISEDEFRTACGKYGVVPGTLFTRPHANVERVDDAYEQKIPDDIYVAAKSEEDTLEYRQKQMKEKEAEREKASKEVKKTEVKENEQLPRAQVASTK